MKQLILMLLIICTAISIYAQQPSKQTPPEGGKPKDFILPAKTTFKLDNGIIATLIPYGSLPKVNVAIIIRSGNINEKADEIWIADITGDLLKEGTKTRSAQAAAQEAAGMGGSIDVSVSPDTTSISSAVLSVIYKDKTSR